MRHATSIAVVTLAVVVFALVALLGVRATLHPLAGLTAAGDARVACHSVDGLPDRTCTPGAVSADVTQATIRSTICRSGYTTRGVRSDGRPVRPPASFTDRLKATGISAYGYADTAAADYEEDHLIPLELGGDGWSPSNLWPEPRYGPHSSAEKDGVENELHRRVCSGQVSLIAAQQAIAKNWETARTAA